MGHMEYMLTYRDFLEKEKVIFIWHLLLHCTEGTHMTDTDSRHIHQSKWLILSQIFLVFSFFLSINNSGFLYQHLLILLYSSHFSYPLLMIRSCQIISLCMWTCIIKEWKKKNDTICITQTVLWFCEQNWLWAWFWEIAHIMKEKQLFSVTWGLRLTNYVVSVWVFVWRSLRPSASWSTFKLNVVQMSLCSPPELLQAELFVAITTLDLSQDQNLLFPP